MAESPLMATRSPDARERVKMRIIRPCVVHGFGDVTQEMIDAGAVEIEMPENDARILMAATRPQAVPAGKQTRSRKAASSGDE